MTAGNVLVPSGGKSVGMLLQLKQAVRGVPSLRDARVMIADRAPVTPAGSFADASFVVPEVGHAAYVDELLRICRDHDVRVLLPAIDIDLDRLAPHVHEFAAAGTTLVCPPPALVELCLDKERFAAFCREEDLPHPRSYPSDALPPDRFPLFFKRRRGFGSIGSGVCRSSEDAALVLARDPDVVFQELVEAPEVSVDVFVSRAGRCTTRVPRQRDKVVGGEAQQSHTVRSTALAGLADRTVAALVRRGLRGPLNIQVFWADEPVLIEVNTRLGSASILSNAATGGRYFTDVLRDACGDGCDGDPDDYVDGLWLQRYWGDVIHDGARTLDGHPPPVPAPPGAAPHELVRP